MTVRYFKYISVGLFMINFIYQGLRQTVDNGQFDNCIIEKMEFDYYGGYGACVTLTVTDPT
jgi:hypothetical protein